MSETRSRPRWLVPVLGLGALALAGVLALTQPWLLFVDTVADEQLPSIASTAAPSADPTTAPTVTAEPTTPSEPAEPTVASGPTVLARGSFISRDHATSGDVAILELQDGTRVLTIEGLETSNGPDLYVYLDDDPAAGPEDAFDDGIDLGPLRANIGDLVYDIPADVDLADVISVAIWCDRFSSLFGAADLTAT